MEERRERREKESNHQTDEQRTERRGVRERGCGDAKGVATEREREREREKGVAIVPTYKWKLRWNCRKGKLWILQA